MVAWYWPVLGFVALAVALIVVANLGTAEKRLQRRVRSFFPVSDPAFTRSVTGVFATPFVPGNRVETLVNGARIFPPMLEAIASARRSINFETFIYWSGEIGERFADALAERARAGVAVNILLDWVGSQPMDAELMRRVSEAGGRIFRYHPPSWRHLARMNNRTHRRFLICDGTVAFTGGVGIADDWLGDADDSTHWRDTHYRVEGPVVAQMQGVFLDNWIKAAGEVLHGDDYFPPLEPCGDMVAQMFGSSPSGGAESMHLMVQVALAAALQEILIASPYFVPDPMTMRALLAAAARGVHVSVLLAGKYTDSRLTGWASQARWDPLLDAGITLLRYRPCRLHWKVLIIDRAWASVGSMNFDSRSFRLNDEANLNVLDPEFALEQHDLFVADAARADRVSRSRWSRRSPMQRSKEFAASLLRSQL